MDDKALQLGRMFEHAGFYGKIGPDNTRTVKRNIPLALQAMRRDPRWYHTDRHVRDMCRWFMRWFRRNGETHSERTLTAIALAVLHHDRVYEPGYAYNELRSAYEFGEQAGMAPELADQVKRLIMTTRLGVSREEITAEPGADVLHDLDYTIFADRKAMSGYERRIRHEFRFVPECDYMAGRLEFLRKLLDRPVYLTLYFGKYNEAARENIKEAISKLS